MEVRPAILDDVWAIGTVSVCSWRAAYVGVIPDSFLGQLDANRDAARWSSLVGLPGASTRVAEDAGRVVGFVHACRSRDEDAVDTTGEIAALYVLPEVWGKGVGRRLVVSALVALTHASMREATLWVFEENLRARRFYEAHGWRPDGATRTENFGRIGVVEVRYRQGLLTRSGKGASI